MTKQELEKLSLFSLRGLGRRVGVKSVTTLVKKELIQEILDISSGEKAPYFTTKGRPAKYFTAEDITDEIKKNQEQIEKLKFKKEDKLKFIMRVVEVKQQIDCLLDDLIREINEKETEN